MSEISVNKEPGGAVIRVTMPGTMSLSDEPNIEVVSSVPVNQCECTALRAELQTRKQTQEIVARSWHQVQADNKQLRAALEIALGALQGWPTLNRRHQEVIRQCRLVLHDADATD